MITRKDEYKTYVELSAERTLRGPLLTGRGTKTLRREVQKMMETTLKGVDPAIIGSMVALAEQHASTLNQHDMGSDDYDGKRVNDVATACAREAWIKKVFRPTLLCLLSRPDTQGYNRTLFTQSPKAIEDGNWTVSQGGVDEDETVVEAFEREVCGEEMPSMDMSQISNIRFEGVHDFELPCRRVKRDGFGQNGKFGKCYIAVSADYNGPQKLEVKRDEIAHYRWVQPSEVSTFLRKIRSEDKRKIITDAIKRRKLTSNILNR